MERERERFKRRRRVSDETLSRKKRELIDFSLDRESVNVVLPHFTFGGGNRRLLSVPPF